MARSNQARLVSSETSYVPRQVRYITALLRRGRTSLRWRQILKVRTLCSFALCILGHLGLVCETLPKAIGAWMVFDNCSGHLGGMARFRDSSIAHGVYRVLQAAAFEEDVLGDAHDGRGNRLGSL